MKAAQFFGKGDVRVVDVAEPQTKDDEVLVEIEWCGICGSDLHEYIIGPVVIPTTTPHALTKETLPVTLGHEFCGRIISAPPTSPFTIGQPVASDPRLYCRTCTFCTSKPTPATVFCPSWGFRGLSGGGGGFSQRIAVSADQVYAVPEGKLEYAALVEPLAVAWHAAKQALLQRSSFAGTSILIVGGGPIGIALVIVLRSLGAELLIVSEPTVARRAQCAEVADHVLDPVGADADVGGRCRALTGGNGVDIVFDAAGVQRGLDAGFDAVRFKGLYVNVAGWETACTINMALMMGKEIIMTSSRAYNDDDFAETVDAFNNGRLVGYEKMVTSRIALKDIARDGFEALVKRKDEHIKILVTPREGVE